MIIAVKSVSVSSDKGDQVMFNTWIYFGNDKQLFEKLKNKYPFSKGLYEKSAGKEFQQPELAFFDSKNLSYTKIIESISDPILRGVKKRIISADQSFYLGSDASDERGEVVNL